MIKNENLTVEQSLLAGINKYVVVKLKNGRAISGTLLENGNGFAIKLGVQFIKLDVNQVARPATVMG